MAMNVGNASGEGEVMVEMNTTPLIDVMLVLLTLLIITLPIQTHAVKLDMPRTERTPPQRRRVVELESTSTARSLERHPVDRETLGYSYLANAAKATRSRKSISIRTVSRNTIRSPRCWRMRSVLG